MNATPAKRTRFDGWLAGICLSRVFNGLVFMSYAAALPVLQREWSMSGAQAGAVAGGFQIGYAVSLVFFSSLADRVSPKRIYLWSMFAAGLSALGFAFFARDFASALAFHTALGVSLGGTYTTGVMILAEQYDARSRGMAVGVFIASTSCGYALSLLISGAALPPSTAKNLVETVERIDRGFGGDRLIVGVSPHTPYTVTPEDLIAVARYASSQRRPLTMHLLETPEEAEWLDGRCGFLSTFLEERKLANAGHVPSGVRKLLEPLEFIGASPLFAHVNFDERWP